MSQLLDELDTAQNNESTTERLTSDSITPVILQYKGNLNDYSRIVSTTNAKLNELQELTEESFLKIGEKLPGINEELSNTGAEAEHLLEYFKKESGLLDDTATAKGSDLKKLSHAADYLINVAGDQSDAFAQMGEMMKRIDNIKNSIESIRDFSIEMEMLSINASIVAIKAGDAGRTLNPITVELKKMANAAIELIDEIVNTSEKLTEKYSLFEELSEQQTSKQRGDIEKTGEQLSSKYRSLQTSISVLVDQLNQIGTAVRDGRQPINDIMNILQIQDILKQCTDHVQLALEEAVGEGAIFSHPQSINNNQPEQLLDAIAFQERAPLLCVQLLDDIDARLMESVKDLGNRFADIKNLLHRVNLCSATKPEAGTRNRVLEEVDASFSGVETIVMQTAGMIQGAANSWEQLWSTATGLETMLNTLDTQFTQLKKLTNFHLINIPIKIEVARSSGLSEDGELAQRVEGLAEYITTEMKQSHKGIIRDHQFLTQMVASMSKHKQDVEENLESIALDVDDLLSNFNTSKSQVKETFGGVCKHMATLDALVDATLADLDKINKLVDQNRELKAEFHRLAAMAGTAKQAIQDVAGISEWVLRSETLNTIVNRFTVLAHKQIAKDLYGVDVEDGIGEGELILF